ncbi:MAG: sialidase family protein [Planctomycetota bacterium]
MSPDAPKHSDPPPPGKTPEDRRRNAALLADYDYPLYPTALTGYSGQDLQRIASLEWLPACRTRVGPRGNYKAGLARQDDGTLVIAVCRNNNEEDPAKRRFGIFVYSSADTGLTWREIGKTALFGKEPSLTVLPDRSLVMTAQGGYFGPGADHDHQPVYRSEDGGVTWQTFPVKGRDYVRNLIVEDDGTLTMIRALRSDWEGKGGGSPNLEVARSTDGGKSWTADEGLVDWDYPGFGEVSSIRLPDGRLLAALRRQIPGTVGEGFEDTVITESNDNGKTWARPWQLLPCAEVHAFLTPLHNGTILATYSSYHNPWGVFAVASSDSGRTWDLDRPFQLALSASFYVGWGATLQLPDDSLLTSYASTSYWKQEPDKFTCEVVRWHLP